MSWSSVATQIATVMTANGYSISSTPIIFENASSIVDSTYSLEYRTSRTSDTINNAYRTRHISNVIIRIAKKLSAGDRMGSYNTFISSVEDTIKDLETTSNWAVSTSTIVYIRFLNNSIRLDKVNYIALADIEIEITHTV